jgi:hypothetical protein
LRLDLRLELRHDRDVDTFDEIEGNLRQAIGKFANFARVVVTCAARAVLGTRMRHEAPIALRLTRAVALTRAAEIVAIVFVVVSLAVGVAVVEVVIVERLDFGLVKRFVVVIFVARVCHGTPSIFSPQMAFMFE